MEFFRSEQQRQVIPMKTLKNILVAGLAASAMMAASAALAQQPTTTAPNPDLPATILVDISAREPGREVGPEGSINQYPLPATPYEQRGLRTTTLTEWTRTFGSGPESMAAYADRANETRDTCEVAQTDTSELLQVMQLLAQLDPWFKSLFDRYEVNLAERLRTANTVSAAANVIQAIFGLWKLATDPEYGLTVLAGAGANEGNRRANNEAQELSRESNMASLLFQRLSVRINMLWGRSEQRWLGDVYPLCRTRYAMSYDPSSIPRLGLDPSITGPIENWSNTDR